jgi:NTE family protein
MTPEELRELMRDADWDIIFLADSPFKYKTFRRKEDARQFPAQIELGLKNG